MNSIFSSKISKIVVDILLIAGIFVSKVSGTSESASWLSFHCIACMVWYALIVVHIWQHWRMTKALAKPNVMKRNKITTLAVIAFCALTFSIVLFVFKIDTKMVNIHDTIANIFTLVMIVHLIAKAKSFLRLFKRDYINNSNNE